MMMMMMGPSLVVRIFYHWNAVSSMANVASLRRLQQYALATDKQTNRGASPSRKASRFAAGLNKRY